MKDFGQTAQSVQNNVTYSWCVCQSKVNLNEGFFFTIISCTHNLKIHSIVLCMMGQCACVKLQQIDIFFQWIDCQVNCASLSPSAGHCSSTAILTDSSTLGSVQNIARVCMDSGYDTYITGYCPGFGKFKGCGIFIPNPQGAVGSRRPPPPI